MDQILCRLWMTTLSMIVYTGLSCSLEAQPSAGLSKKQIAEIERVVEKQIEQQQLVGVVVSVIQDGEVAFARAWGFEDREREIPTSDQTMFRWASISKPVTAVAAMILVDEGKLDLDADVRQYVPEFPDKGVPITSRQLLCHQSGIVHYTNGPVIQTETEYDVANPFESVLLSLDHFKESPLVHSPGEAYSYSTHAYILMSAVVERAADQPYAEFVRERIFKPLGMDSMQPDYQWRDIPHRAVGYIRRPAEGIVPSTDTDVSWKLGGGGFISNITDMAKFAAALSRQELLSRRAYDEMWTVQILNSEKLAEAGLGFFIHEPNAQRVVSHNGSQEKTRTRMVIYPESKLGIVVMTNSEYGQPGRITTAIVAVLNKSF